MSEQQTVKAGPTKRFFVEMLTRDIDLKDAILDLLDNCIDGILRQLAASNGRPPSVKPYQGFKAEITAKPDRFEIVDNCGGIPLPIALEYAFMLGRPDLERDAQLETVGMYGIGMKRAIFKMGRRCSVTSSPTDGAFRVDITPEWLTEKDGDWDLPLSTDVEPLPEAGTRIEIGELYDSISRQFDENQSTFVDDLKKEVSRLYAMIIDKGFDVRVNGDLIQPVEIKLLFPKETPKKSQPAIAPFFFEGEIDEVEVNVAVGFYRKLATEAEIEDEAIQPRTSEVAGWTVICNDRVVLYADKSAVTGWGTGNVPRYHNQFIAISGAVIFRSRNSFKLPLNTTKRGLDTSSPVYLYVLDIMKDGLKRFTDFTNKWKSRETETDPLFDGTASVEPLSIPSAIGEDEWTTARKVGGEGSGRKFIPTLPVPVDQKDTVRISFSRKRTEVERVASKLFGDPTVKPSQVGEKCFEEQLRSVRR